MHRILLLGALLLACTAPTEPAKPAAPTPPTPPTAPTPPTPPPPIAETPPPSPPAAPPAPLAGHRDLHPRPGLGDGCVEMYSACSPDGKGAQRCTSARYDLDCGQTGEVPNGGDKVRCVCP